jgi:predicted O-methyltransferase YrrM
MIDRIVLDYPNWFVAGGAEENFEKYLTPYAGKKIKALQIGAYTGDATQWMFDNILDNSESTLTDVDTWMGSDEPDHKPLNWKSVEEVYDKRFLTQISSGNLLKMKMTSDDFFLSNKEMYDFIYVDGDHKAETVLRDGVNAVQCLNPYGIIAFDDYMWSQHKGPAHDPKAAIDAIRLCYSDQFTVLEIGLQVWMIKNS